MTGGGAGTTGGGAWDDGAGAGGGGLGRRLGEEVPATQA